MPLGSIYYRFRDIAAYWSKIATHRASPASSPSSLFVTHHQDVSSFLARILTLCAFSPALIHAYEERQRGRLASCCSQRKGRVAKFLVSNSVWHRKNFEKRSSYDKNKFSRYFFDSRYSFDALNVFQCHSRSRKVKVGNKENILHKVYNTCSFTVIT